MTQVSYKDLVKDKQYIIYESGDNVFWKGTFREEIEQHRDIKLLIFVDCIQTGIDLYPCRVWIRSFSIMNTFHDVEKIKENRKKAIQNMENRALDMILKKLVNEHFEW